ncbi:MAG: glycosyltransferase family 4 protein [Candidatus Shapirobacteria bacterium]
MINKNKIYGGGVKLLHLNKKYPENKKNFNILYLVSSYLPFEVQEWINKAKKIGAKIVWNQNGVAYPAWAGERAESINRQMSEFMHQSDYVIYQSKFCKTSADIYIGIFEKESSVVYNSVDSKLFNAKKLDLNKNIITMLVMGTHYFKERVLGPIKVLSEMIKSGHEAKLIIGGGLVWSNGENETREKVKELGLDKKVEILGPYNQKEAPIIYKKADILIHLQYNDSCPTVPLEAMSVGVPVVAGASGGLRELVGNDGGILIPITQSYEKMYYPTFKEIMDSVLKLTKNYHKYSKACVKRIKNIFEVNLWLKKHENIFEKLLNES